MDEAVTLSPGESAELRYCTHLVTNYAFAEIFVNSMYTGDITWGIPVANPYLGRF